MAFFPRAIHGNSSSFTPLFRLLDDFDNYARQDAHGPHANGKRSSGTFWQPKFDVRESEDQYELHGELPGLSKDNVQIEFTEPQTLVISGRSERSFTSGTPPTDLVDQPSIKAAVTEGGESEATHKATVEDADEGSASAVQSAASADVNDQQVTKSHKKSAKADVKYWLSERTVGEFSRTFTFPLPVDQDAVSASFNNGLLTLNVPKAKKSGARRIAIN